MPAMHNHFLFIGNVFAHWVATMSSVVSFTLGIVEYVRDRKTEAWIFTIIASLFLIVSFDAAWQDEHRNANLLTAEKASAYGEREFWKQQSYAKDASLRNRDDLLAQNFGVLQQTQSSLATLSNRLLDVAKPEPFHADVMRWQIPGVLHTPDGPVQLWALVLVGNRTIAETKGTFTCDSDFTALDSHIVTRTGSLRTDYQQTTPTSVRVEYIYPPWGPKNPLVFAIATKQGHDIKSCSFKLD